jgi:hypothetical protein
MQIQERNCDPTAQDEIKIINQLLTCIKPASIITTTKNKYLAI